MTSAPSKQIDYAAAREKYNPARIGKRIGVLWIAESPPAGGGYFYFEKTSGRDHLFRETMKALGWWGDSVPMHAGMNKAPYLKKFQENGQFLIDLSPAPVNTIRPENERNEVLCNNVGRTIREIGTLNPGNILILKRNVFEILHPAIRKSKFSRRLLNREFVPFPSHGWQAEYRRRIRGYISSVTR